MANKNGMSGCEIHRLKEFGEYDRDQFDRLYKVCKPLVRNLSRNIDCKRYNVSRDIIQSYFWDKFMFVYSKYHQKYDEERLKATLLSSLQTYKNKLLRNAYTPQAEFNQELTSFEVLYDGSKEFHDDTDETRYKEDLSKRFHQFMKDNLTDDEYLLFITELNPPPFFKERMEESHGKLSILHIIDYFELPRDRKSQTKISEMRHNIKNTLKRAGQELKR